MTNQTAFAIDVREAHKSFGNVHALAGVSLHVKDNEFFTLLGPSGCGKTTLLRIIAGFEQPDSGTVALFGEDMTGLPPYQRQINTVFQHYALFPHMTVTDNVSFGLRRLKKPENEVQRITADMLALVKMSDVANRHPAQLSGGQQQRVALARALAPHPKVLLLDEPLSALDLKLRQAMRLELKKLQRETGITFVLVTHDQDEALVMSDRIAVMEKGKIRQIGTPEDVYEHPANSYVADFIGEANLLLVDCQTVDDGIARCLFADDEITVAAASGVRAGEKARLFIRPERVTLEATDAAPAHGIITEVAYQGDSVLYEVKLAHGVARAVAAAHLSQRFAAGDSVRLSFPAEAARALAD